MSINTFFNTLYQTSPTVEEVKKNTNKYSVAGKDVSIVTDPYGGCHIEVANVPAESALMKNAIQQLAGSLTCDSIWVNFPFPTQANSLGTVIPDSFQIGVPGKGDVIYDYQQKKIRFWQWLNPNKECSIPSGATHNLGATALLIDKAAQKVLLVENMMRKGSWNLPGGSFEPEHDKSPAYTALREAQEEGGFKVEAKMAEAVLMGQMQFPNNQFAPAINQIWAFFIDGISQQALNPPANEICRAEWIDVKEVLNSTDTLGGLKIGPEIKATLDAALKGNGMREVMNKGWMILNV